MGRKSRQKAERPAPAEAMPPSEPASSGRRHVALVCAVLAILVAVIFLQLRDHEFVGYDDDIYVTRNDQVKAGWTAAGVRWAFTSMDFNWHPVTWLTHMTDVELFGLNAGRHLLVNAALHATNAILLFLFLLRATKRLWPSAFVAALFAVHPLHVESVAWLAERKDVLSTLFFLVALLLYLRWTEGRSKAVYAALVVVFALGLMSKGMLVTLPLILLLLDFWPLRRANFPSLLLEKVPLFALIVPSAILTVVAQHAVKAIAQSQYVPLSIRLANASLSYIAYLGKTVWPSPLAIPYPYPSVISPTRSIAAALALIAISGWVVVFRKRRPYLFTGWFWFAGALVPVIGVIQIGVQAMADRYMYIPMIGLSIAVVWLIDDALSHRPALRVPLVAASAAMLAIFTYVAQVQAAYWKDTVTLFRHSVAVTGDNFTAHLALGSALLANNERDEAVRELERAVAISPSSAVAHDDLAAAYASLGRIEEGQAEYRKALALDPNDRAAQNGVAALSLQAGNVDDALKRYTTMVREQPQSAAAHNDLASALSRAGREDDALREYEQALRLDASLYDAHMNIAALLSRRKREAEAIQHLHAANKLQPEATEPHVYLALVYAQTSRASEAIREAQAALALDETTANTQFTDAVRAPAAPDNLRRFVAAMRAR